VKYIDIRFEFEEVTEDDYTYHDLVTVSLEKTDIDEKSRSSIAETFAQSDRYWVDTCNTIVNVIGGEPKVTL
jgi:hypothetical protein